MSGVRFQQEQKGTGWKEAAVAGGISGAIVLVRIGLYNLFKTNNQNYLNYNNLDLNGTWYYW